MTTDRNPQAFVIDNDIYFSVQVDEEGADYFGRQLSVDEACRLRDALDQAIEHLQSTEQAA